jgi:hypothetical protein
MPLSLILKAWEGVNSTVTSPETGLATTASILRRARKYRGVTVSKAAVYLFLERNFCLFYPALFPSFIDLHAGTRVI